MTSAPRSPMLWLPTLYFAKGMPYVVVTVLMLLFLRQKGLGVAEVTLLASACYLPWVLKPWWRPLLSPSVSWRGWILLSESLLSLAFAVLAFTVGSVPAVFALMLAIASLTALHNVAVDELYRSGVPAEERYAYRHVRELSRKLAVVVGQGIIVMLVGNLQVFYRHNIGYSWSFMFYLVSGVFLLFALWHSLVVPRGGSRSAAVSAAGAMPGIAMWFLLCYALSPALQSKVAILFLLESQSAGGLGLSPQEFGLVMGSLGILGLTTGGLLGVKAIRTYGLHRCLWPMALAMPLPALVYVWLSTQQPTGLWVAGGSIFVEQLCFGWGYAAYLKLLRRLGPGELRKSLMALSLLLPCALSGMLAELLGYDVFFLVALLSGAAALAVTAIIRKNPIAE